MTLFLNIPANPITSIVGYLTPVRSLYSLVVLGYLLIALCKNHHWELDHNLLSKENLDKLIGAAGIEPA